MTLEIRIAALETKRHSSTVRQVSALFVSELRARREASKLSEWDRPMSAVEVTGMTHATLPGETGRDAVSRILSTMTGRPAVALAFPADSVGVAADGDVA